MQFNDVRNHDEQRQNERRNILLKLVKKEFPNAVISVIPEKDLNELWRIRVEVSAPQKIAISLQPNRPLMTDTNNRFEEIFTRGISFAKQIFNAPPLEEIYQGKIHLTNDDVKFEKYEY